jgi:hypothetical protein
MNVIRRILTVVMSIIAAILGDYAQSWRKEKR